MMGGALVGRVAARAAAASILLAVASVGVAAGGEGARARTAPAREAGAVGSRAATIRGGVRAEVRPGEAGGECSGARMLDVAPPPSRRGRGGGGKSSSSVAHLCKPRATCSWARAKYRWRSSSQ